MRKIPLLLICIICATVISAQDDSIHHGPPPPPMSSNGSSASGDKVFQVVEQMPEYEGGESALMKFVQTNIRYPSDAWEAQIQGREIVSFIIRPNGTVDSITVKGKLWPSMDAEAKRVVALTEGNWKPGKQQGRDVSVKFILPIMFRTSGGPLTSVSNPYSQSDDEQKAFEALKAQHYKKALSLYQAVCNAHPTNDFAALNLGLCFYQTGDTDAACAKWQAIHDRDVHIADLLLSTYCRGKR